MLESRGAGTRTEPACAEQTNIITSGYHYSHSQHAGKSLKGQTCQTNMTSRKQMDVKYVWHLI